MRLKPVIPIDSFVTNGSMCYAVYTEHGRQHCGLLVTVVMCKMADLLERVATRHDADFVACAVIVDFVKAENEDILS